MTFIKTDILNPYQREILSTDSYNRLIDFLIEKFPEGFDKPVDISINGKEIAVDDYDIELNDRDIIVLLDRTALPVGLIGGWFVTALANLAISITLGYISNKLFAPDAPADQPQPSSVYNINNAQNTARYGSPIPIIYGQVRMYPSMIVQPYYRFDDDVEYLYHVLCVGQGRNTTDLVLIGDDEITDTGVLEWKLLNKEDFYNIPLNAYGYHITKTLAVPSTMEIKIANGETEKYTVSKDADYVEVDYTYPNGLKYYEDDGETTSAKTSFKIRVYVLSSGVYTEVYSEDVYMNASTVDAIQRTKTIDISSYDEPVYISFEKTLGKATNKYITNTVIKRVKEIYPNEDFTNKYGDITLLACKIKATDAVSAAGQVRVNAYFERTDVGNTMAEVLTDIYTNTTYGAGLDVNDLDFPVTTETVNCAYENSSTIFDAMRRPALAQGYSLYLAGMDVILKKDGANTITSGMFNEMNILRNSLKVQYLFKEEYPAYDGFECSYISDNWTQKTEIYPSTSTRPQSVDLFGVATTIKRSSEFQFLDIVDTITDTQFDTPEAVAISGNYAFVTGFVADSLTAIDISDPTNITIADSVTSTDLNGARCVAISGNYAYVVSVASGARITAVNISDPSNMVIGATLSHADMSGATDIAISGNNAYISAYNTDSIVSVSITTPGSPLYLDTYTNATSLNGASSISISGAVAYVTADLGNCITSIDISNPSSMSELDTFSGTAMSRPLGIDISGDVAYIASITSDSIVSIDISNPSSMSQLDSLSVSQLNGARSLAIVGNYAFVCAYVADKVAVIDISDPNNMSYHNSVTVNDAYNIGASGDVVYIVGQTTDTVTSIFAKSTGGTLDIFSDATSIASSMSKYLWKQDKARRKIVTFQTDIQGLVPQFLDKIMVSHSSLQWGEAGEVVSRSSDDLVLSDRLVNQAAGKTIVFRNIDGSVSDPYSITIVDEVNITVTGMPAWVDKHTFYTIQDTGTAKEFLVIAVKPAGDSVQIDCVNYDESIYT